MGANKVCDCGEAIGDECLEQGENQKWKLH